MPLNIIRVCFSSACCILFSQPGPCLGLRLCFGLPRGETSLKDQRSSCCSPSCCHGPSAPLGDGALLARLGSELHENKATSPCLHPLGGWHSPKLHCQTHPSARNPAMKPQRKPEQPSKPWLANSSCHWPQLRLFLRDQPRCFFLLDVPHLISRTVPGHEQQLLRREQITCGRVRSSSCGFSSFEPTELLQKGCIFPNGRTLQT